MIQIHLGRNGEPDRVTFAQHDHGDARRWGSDRGMRLQHADGRERIVVFVAPFSHASYYSPGTKFYAGGTDSPDELGPLELPPGRTVRRLGKLAGPVGRLAGADGHEPAWTGVSGREVAERRPVPRAPEGAKTVAAGAQGDPGGRTSNLPAQARNLGEDRGNDRAGHFR
jgi:hypothetical protein